MIASKHKQANSKVQSLATSISKGFFKKPGVGKDFHWQRVSRVVRNAEAVGQEELQICAAGPVIVEVFSSCTCARVIVLCERQH